MYRLSRITEETFIRKVEFHAELGSTNSRGMELAAGWSDFPGLILAEQQTAGRGRGAHRWWSGEGGVTFSVLIDGFAAGMGPDRWSLVSLTAGLAVAEALQHFVPTAELRLKWPNDVFLGGRKVCGILVETASSRHGVLVVGIGVNVNNSFVAAPDELRGTGTSLRDFSGNEWDCTQVLIALLQQLETCLAAVPREFAEVAERWRERCYLHGRTVQIRSGLSGDSAGVTGVCQSIDDDGALLLQTETGLTRCTSGIVAKIL